MWRFFLSARFTPVRLSRDGGIAQPKARVPWAVSFCFCVFAIAALTPSSIRGLTATGSREVGSEAPVTVPLAGVVVAVGTGKPIPAATVLILDEGFRERADDLGRFAFMRLPGGTYRLQASAVGYETVVTEPIVVVEHQPRQITIEMTPTVYSLEDITVVAEPSRGARPVIRISREVIGRSQVESVPELLSQVQGVYVQSGGPGGKSQVRMRGSDAAQVLVLVDGQRINPSGTGVADLATIPLDVIQEIEIHTGGASAEFGPDAMAGAINIKTRPVQSHTGFSGSLKTGAGGWDSRSLQTSIANPFAAESLESLFAYSRTASDGDFSYEYSVDGVGGQPDTVLSGIRQNNESHSSNLFGSGTFGLSTHSEIGYSMQVFKARRGLPGTVENADSTGESTDERVLSTLSLLMNKGQSQTLETMFGFSRYAEEFTNRDMAVHAANRYASKFLNEVVTVRQSLSGRLLRSTDHRVAVEYRRDRLFHDDFLRPQFSMGRADRANWGMGGALSHREAIAWTGLFAELHGDLSVRYDRADTRSNRAATAITPAGRSHRTEYLAPLAAISLTGGRLVTYTVSMSYGKSLRLPGLNALFWRGDSRSAGNPDLRPEQSEHSELAVDLTTSLGPVTASGSAGYFHAAVTDLVVWQPNFQGAWQPNNVGRALITGHEESLELAAFDRLVRIRYQNAVTNAINKLPLHTVNGKRLPFYPNYLTTVTFQVRYRGMSAAWVTQLAGRTFTNDANTRSYPSYAVSDVRLGLDLALAEHWRIETRGTISNITDEAYVLMAQYPMPGRGAEFSLALTYGLTGK